MLLMICWQKVAVLIYCISTFLRLLIVLPWGGGGGPTQKNTNAPLKFQIRIRIFRIFSYFLQIVILINRRSHIFVINQI